MGGSGGSQDSIQRAEAATESKTAPSASRVSAVSDRAGTGSVGLGDDRVKSESNTP